MLRWSGYIQECCIMAVLSQASNLGAKQAQHSCSHKHAAPVISYALPVASWYALQPNRARLHTQLPSWSLSCLAKECTQ